VPDGGYKFNSCVAKAANVIEDGCPCYRKNSNGFLSAVFLGNFELNILRILK